MGKRNYQSLPHLTADAARLVEDLEKETDRGVALLAAAFLDDVLDVMLRASFVENEEAVNRLVGVGRPLESFGARTHVAYCVGLLGDDVYADINLIREIRNDFAHRQPRTFEVQEIRDKCHKLGCVSATMPVESCSARERFIASIVVIANHLMVLTGQLTHARPGKSFVENGVLRVR